VKSKNDGGGDIVLLDGEIGIKPTSNKSSPSQVISQSGFGVKVSNTGMISAPIQVPQI